MNKKNFISIKSFVITLLIHLFVFLIPSKTSTESLKLSINNNSDINIAISSPPPPKRKSITSQKKPVKPIKQHKTTSTSKIKSKPKHHPGDRSTAKIIKTSKQSPIFPKKALNNNWTGTVTVLVTIDKNGSPSKFEIIKSTSYPLLDNAFISTIKEKWKFKPKQKYGKKLSSTLKLSYTFE